MQAYRITVSSKGQIVIPAELRRKLKIKQGARVRITESKGRIQIVPDNIDIKKAIALRGAFKGTGLWEELQKMKREEREREDRKR